MLVPIFEYVRLKATAVAISGPSVSDREREPVCRDTPARCRRRSLPPGCGGWRQSPTRRANAASGPPARRAAEPGGGERRHVAALEPSPMSDSPHEPAAAEPVLHGGQPDTQRGGKLSLRIGD